jgi:hypothetical protein
MSRYRVLPTRTTDVIDLTSLTVDELAAPVPPFEAAFLGYMAEWTLHGRRRQARRYTTDKNSPLPTPEERLLFVLVDLKPHPTQLLHGRLFGMHRVEMLRRYANRWERQQQPHQWQRGKPPHPPRPPLAMTVPSDPSRAPTTRLNRKLTIAARKSGTC